MEEIKKIPFADALQTCVNFIKEPELKVNIDAMVNLKKQLVIYDFIPIAQKVVCLYEILLDANESYDLPVPTFTAALEISFFFNGLLSYTNIEKIIPKEVKIYEAYDAFYRSGLADYILNYCQKDYQRLCNMAERSFNFVNLHDLLDTMQGLDSDIIKESMSTLKEMQDSMDPDVIKNMVDILRYNDPTLYKIKEDLLDQAIEKINKIDAFEQLRNINLSVQDE